MAKFDQLVHILRKATNLREEGGILCGNLSVDSAELLSDLKECVDAPEETGLTIELDGGRDPELTIGAKVSIAVATPRPSFGLVRKDLEALLRSQSAHVREPSRYYLWEKKVSASDAAQDGSPVDRYRKVIALVQILKGAAAFLDQHEELLVFIRSGKFEVPVKYAVADLEALDLTELGRIIASVPDGTHKTQCESIMAEAMHEVVSLHSAGYRFSALLGNLKDFHERFDRGYRLFVAGFSYEKLRDEIETAKIEYTTKMHKVFADIQNQLLGIPVATVIVATQMKPHERINGDFWISVAVLLGSFVFAMLVHLLLRNQRHTLEVVGLEMERQRKALEKHPKVLLDKLLPTFELLVRRYKVQLKILDAIDLVVIGGVVLSVFFFYQLSMPTKQWLDQVIIALTT